MSGRYDDIISLPHHVSGKRRPMSMTDRAAQFSPFAALTGYDASIEEMRRLTDSYIHLAMDGQEQLNDQLVLLSQEQDAQPGIRITYFVPDERKQGGAYRTYTGHVKKVDTYEKSIVFLDGTSILFSRIYGIEFLEKSEKPTVDLQLWGIDFAEETL